MAKIKEYNTSAAPVLSRKGNPDFIRVFETQILTSTDGGQRELPERRYDYNNHGVNPIDTLKIMENRNRNVAGLLKAAAVLGSLAGTYAIATGAVGAIHAFINTPYPPIVENSLLESIVISGGLAVWKLGSFYTLRKEKNMRHAEAIKKYIDPGVLGTGSGR